MDWHQQGELFIKFNDYLNKKYSSFSHPSEFDKCEITKLIIKHEVTEFLIDHSSIKLVELKNITNEFFDYLFIKNNHTKLLYSRIDITITSGERCYGFHFKNLNYYLLNNGHEALDQREIRIEQQMALTLSKVPAVLLSYKINEPGLDNFLKKIFYRIVIDHYFIDNHDFLPLLHHLVKQYLKKSSIFSPLVELQRETYVYKGSRDFIITHPSHYEARYRNS
jgi:hypothetical protein